MTSPASEDQAQAKVARYQIGEVADRTGVTQRTLRFYEEKGLLRPPERMDGGFRLYSDDDVQRIEYIRQLQQYLGFTLAEIKEMVEAEDLRQQIISTFRPDRAADSEPPSPTCRYRSSRMSSSCPITTSALMGNSENNSIEPRCSWTLHC